MQVDHEKSGKYWLFHLCLSLEIHSFGEKKKKELQQHTTTKPTILSNNCLTETQYIKRKNYERMWFKGYKRYARITNKP